MKCFQSLQPPIKYLIVKERQQKTQPVWPLVVRKFLGYFKFFLYLLHALSGLHHFGHLVLYDHEIAFLFLQVCHTPADVHRPVTGNKRLHWQLTLDNHVEDFGPPLDMGHCSPPRMDFGIEQIAHEHDSPLRDIKRQIASGVSVAFRRTFPRELESEAAQVNRHAVLEPDIRRDEFLPLVCGAYGVGASRPFAELR